VPIQLKLLLYPCLLLRNPIKILAVRILSRMNLNTMLILEGMFLLKSLISKSFLEKYHSLNRIKYIEASTHI
jgi:hypothetical protein